MKTHLKVQLTFGANPITLALKMNKLALIQSTNIFIFYSFQSKYREQEEY